MSLLEEARSYLEAEGYEVNARAKDLLVGMRRGVADEMDVTYVWAPAIRGPMPRSTEGPLLGRFKESMDIHPFAQRYLLVPSTEGMSREFRQGAKQWYNVNVRVPAQFFDTAFRWEESSEAPSAARDLRSEGERLTRHRAAQPYEVSHGGEVAGSGDDLLADLYQAISDETTPKRSPIHMVVGPAGAGKSHLFAALYAQLYADFIAAKQEQRAHPRPLPLLPQHLEYADGPSVKAALRAFLGSDFARPLDMKVLEWRLTHGWATWLIDGLDEVIAQDAGFFDYLVDLLTAPGGFPTVVICVRDSLLGSLPSLTEFAEDYGEFVSVYRLSPWADRSKRQLAEARLGDGAEAFMARLHESAPLSSLAATAYYCSLLIDRFEHGDLKDGYSERELIGDALSAVIEREYGKTALRQDAASHEELRDYMEAIAAQDLQDGFVGVPVSTARELAEVVLPAGLSRGELDKLVRSLVQIPLFSTAGAGSLRFAQEPMEHYLIARSVARQLRAGEASVVRLLGATQLPRDGIAMRILSDAIREENLIQSVEELSFRAVGQPLALKNVLQMLLGARPGPANPRLLPLERQDLSGLEIVDQDLSTVSLRGSDLTDTVFRRTRLDHVDFSDAILKNTAFVDLPEDALQDAEFSDLARFFSIRIGKGNTIASHKDAQRWLEKRTSRRIASLDPCPTAQQLRFIFSKFVRLNGTARRDVLDRKGVVSGRRIADAEAVLDAAIRFGYLSQDHRERVSRPKELYAEFVAFVTGMRVSPGLRALLADACDIQDCVHVPTTPEEA